jgi:hypothetical protein
LKSPFSVIVSFAILLTALSCSAQENKRGPSTAEERARAVRVASALRKDPLAPSVTSDREWLFRWMVEIPDISLSLCSGLLGELGKSKTGHPGLILISSMASQAAFVIEHPDKANDKNATYFAGVEGALATYKAIREKDPKYKAPGREELLQKQEKGQLEETIKTRVATGCKG